MKTPIENLRLPRTTESTLYEVGSAIMLLLAWIAGVMATNAHRKNGVIITVLLVFTIVAAIAHYISYRPGMRWDNNNFHPANVREAIVVSKFYRVFAIELTSLGLVMALMALWDMKFQESSTVFTIVTLAIIVVNYMLTARKLMRIRDDEWRKQQQNNTKTNVVPPSCNAKRWFLQCKSMVFARQKPYFCSTKRWFFAKHCYTNSYAILFFSCFVPIVCIAIHCTTPT